MNRKPHGLFKRIFLSAFLSSPSTRADIKTKRFFLRNLLLHSRPTSIPESTLRFSFTWGLGGMATVLVLLQVVTGILLKFVYEPIPAQAYTSILVLQQEVLFGKLIRNLHHWSANILVLVVFLHFLRVFFTGAFHPPRQFNWVIGLGLFLLILGAGFTGYLLPWDQLAYWAVTISTGMLEYVPAAGPWLQDLLKVRPELGPESLRIFYTFHTAVIPVLLVGFMAFHFWRVRKAGGLVIPRARENGSIIGDERVPTVPNLIVRELAVGLALIAFVLMLAVFFDAPLANPANPGLSPNPAKAPWYFGGVQALLLHFHPTFAVLVIPSLILTALLLLPYGRYGSDTSGIWFASPIGLKTAGIAAVLSLTVTPLFIILDEHVLDFAGWLPGLPHVLSTGLMPFLLGIGVVLGFYLLLKRFFSVPGSEAVQAVFVLLCGCLIILTIVNIWFRGPGMALTIP
jgi:quinol-cytochrome oxidoreductase complex cytochrome b subunit